MAATLCSDKVATGVCDSEAGALMHGPTFMANPLACAIAFASVELLISQPWQRVVKNLETQLEQGLAPARACEHVNDVRVLGSIGVIEMKETVDMNRIQQQLVDQGIWLRPFGKLVYTIPPYVMDDSDLATLTASMVEVVAAHK